MNAIVAVCFKRACGIEINQRTEVKIFINNNSNSYFIKSVYSIQKTPSLLPWAISSCRKCCGQSVHSSDQLPFQEKRPQGFRSRNSLMWGAKIDKQR